MDDAAEAAPRRRWVMSTWITLLAIALVALLAARVWARLRRAAPAVPVEPEPKRGAPSEMGATIRSYVIPGRWLRAPPPPRRLREEAVAHPQYTGATVERGDAGPTGTSWALLRGRTRLGRDSDNHVVLEDERVSQHHALISVRDGVYWLEDLGSTNGTFVGDDKRVMEAHALVDGEAVRLGGVLLVFRGTSVKGR